MRQAFLQKGLAQESLNVILSSLTSTSWKQYESAFKRWFKFCDNTSPFESDLEKFSRFLTELYESGSSYGTLNTTRSALSLVLPNIDNQTVGSHPYISRFLKGVGKLRPPLPRYENTWDTSLVTTYIKNLGPNENLNYTDLTLKCVGLIALASAQRVQTIASIKLSKIIFREDEVLIYISDQLKTSKPGKPQPCLRMPKFTDKPEWCIFSCLQEYIKQTSVRRSNSTDSLFLSLSKPYRSVGSQTISRWVKSLLMRSGVDTSIFKAHSCRHASTSAALKLGVSIDAIRRTAGWSATSNVFAKFYDRPIVDPHMFAKTVLNE